MMGRWPLLAGFLWTLAVAAGPLDFQLESSDGPVSLGDYRGKVVFLYFGYASCPDICPTSLGVLASAFRQLDQRELARVQGLFVTVDPERDDLKTLDEYVRWFHPRIRALTGSVQAIAGAAALFGVHYEKVPMPGSAMGYSVNHTAAIYLLTPQGELGYVFPHGTPAAVLAEAARYVLEMEEGQKGSK
jgi:protein SCO1/2